MKKKLVILSIGMLPLVATHAQQQDTTLVRTVVVENEYNPTVMDASKINVLPKVEEPTVPKTHIDYANSIRPLSAWNYQAMQPIVKDWKADAAYRGYLRAGYGNNGNVDARLGYLWDISKKDRLNLSASFGGWNGDMRGWHWQENNWMGNDWTSRLYNTQVGLDYKHAFKKVDLMLGGKYRSQVFTYMPISNWIYDEIPGETAYRAPATTRQHQTLGNGYIGFASTDKDMPIQFAAEVGMRYFKMKYATMYQKDGNENNLYVKGNVWKKIDDESRAGLKVKFDNYSYSSESMDGATALDLNPHYGYENDDWRVRLGANVDWWSGVYNIGTGDENKIYVSPDLSMEHFFADSYVFYAKAGGGRQTNSFYQLTTQYSPYWITRDLLLTYVALDAALGIKGSPVNGLWFNLSGGYKITENDFVPVGLTADYDAYFASVTDCKTKLFYGTGELKYDFKDVWNMYLKGTYYSWKAEDMMLSSTPDAVDSDALGLLPEFEINAGVGFKVLEGLKVNVGYDLVKRRDGDRYDPISNLHAGADYALLKNVSIFAKVNNLLNKEYVRHDGYPAQKLNLLAGVSIQF